MSRQLQGDCAVGSKGKESLIILAIDGHFGFAGITSMAVAVAVAIMVRPRVHKCKVEWLKVA